MNHDRSDRGRFLKAVPLQAVGYGGGALLGPHFGTFAYKLPAEEAASRETIEVNGDEEFWRLVFDRKLKAGMSLTLDGFQVSDWFPRAPGLYQTRRAAWIRQEALRFVRRDLQRPSTAVSPDSGRDYTVVLTPEGKESMLLGGVGSIRLKPVTLPGGPHWMLVATSTGIAHGGVPLAMPKRLYQRLLARRLDDGRARLRIHGELDFVPDPFTHLFMDSGGVPKIYLRVDDLEIVEGPLASSETSVAVSFISEYMGPPRIYATYVTFRPDLAGSFDEAVAWMKNEYVEGEYKGQIVTDFDQTQTVFPEASLSLRKVMGRLVSRGEVEEVVNLMYTSASIDRLFTEIDRADLLPARRRRPRDSVFISYAHAAERETGWVARVRTHLGGLDPQTIDVWDDTRIRPGQRWRREIEAAIRKTRVAVLVITADFMASEFIREAELPPLLEAAEADGATILCVYGSEVHLSGIGRKLLDYQWLNTPEASLQALSKSKREALFKNLARRVEEVLAGNRQGAGGRDGL